MSDTVITVKNISKMFTIGAAQPQYRTLRDHIVDSMGMLFQRNGKRPTHKETIWALRDVCFDVKQGEVLGIIGRNGAGKSTLLKIFSRITDPTQGSAEIRGRVGCLLEVGTGFHPELTGRENIYLNGAILGMRKAEIDRKFDEIVAFSEVEKFIDTPVKRYSSGMHVRLAFAVAAHLEPEILVIDEVLAVGDISFQKKCLGKMGDVARQGRTVLFVSHNLGAISNLCTAALCLEGGRVAAHGSVESVIASYIKSVTVSNESNPDRWHRTGSGEVQFSGISLLDQSGSPSNTFSMGETIAVEFSLRVHKPCSSIKFGMYIHRVETEQSVLHLVNEDCGFSVENLSRGVHRFRVEIPNCMLYPSSYSVSLWAGVGKRSTFDFVDGAASFFVFQSSVSKRTLPFRSKYGVYFQPSLWMTVPGQPERDEPSTSTVEDRTSS